MYRSSCRNTHLPHVRKPMIAYHIIINATNNNSSSRCPVLRQYDVMSSTIINASTVVLYAYNTVMIHGNMCPALCTSTTLRCTRENYTGSHNNEQTSTTHFGSREQRNKNTRVRQVHTWRLEFTVHTTGTAIPCFGGWTLSRRPSPSLL